MATVCAKGISCTFVGVDEMVIVEVEVQESAVSTTTPTLTLCIAYINQSHLYNTRISWSKYLRTWVCSKAMMPLRVTYSAINISAVPGVPQVSI
jgi:hypothetical protein